MGGGDLLEGAFADPVLDAQGAFRAIMDALARPGRILTLPALCRPPLPLVPAAGSVALTLCDNDTPIWLDRGLTESSAVAAWLGFHTGAAVVEKPAEAHFALVSRPAELEALDIFAQGSQEYPDRSTTIVLQVDSLTAGASLHLEGPGVNGRASIAPSPLPDGFVDQWRANRSRFPRGVDLILVGAETIACLPRSTRIAQAGGD